MCVARRCLGYILLIKTKGLNVMSDEFKIGDLVELKDGELYMIKGILSYDKRLEIYNDDARFYISYEEVVKHWGIIICDSNCSDEEVSA